MMTRTGTIFTTLRKAHVETVPLRRGGEVVTSLLASFGHGLRETRLTAALGYLIAMRPETFQQLLGLRGVIRLVSLEHFHDLDRSDIQIQTSHGDVVVEAKTDPVNPALQARKYQGTHRVLITSYHPTNRERALKNCAFVTWNEIASILRSQARGPGSAVKVISEDLLNYLEDHHMITAQSHVEIYAREINEPVTLQLFLKAAIYGCNYQANSRLAEAQYFAPYFGQQVAIDYPGIQPGISYVARIESVEPFESWDDFRQVVTKHRGRAWFNKQQNVFDAVTWLRERGRRVVLLVNKPQLVFNPPVHKEHFQRGSGRLSKKFLTFEELFKAWGK